MYAQQPGNLGRLPVAAVRPAHLRAKSQRFRPIHRANPEFRHKIVAPHIGGEFCRKNRAQYSVAQ
jgi:hypothetical protein